ncbi:MAG: class I SAM-dependent methyltransferase [Sphingobacteriia bacterium]|nr:class I SAM-dependent methyltransferase [Sphingobacteriia bacterium]
MLVEKVKFYWNYFNQESRKFIEEIKYRVKHIAEGNEELCYFYFFNKSYKDLELRLKILKYFYPNYAPYTFFDGVISFFKGDKVKAKECFLKFKEVDPRHAINNYYLNILDNVENITLPEDVVRLYFEVSANFYTQLNNASIELYVSQIGVNQDKLKLDQEKVSVLDLGCGTGIFTKKIYKFLGKNPEIIAIDFASNMLEKAIKKFIKEEKYLYLQTINKNAFDYLEQDNTKFDIIIASELIPYVNDLETLFKSLANKMFDSSKVILTFEFNDNKENRSFSTDYFKYIYTRDYIKEILHKNKLKIVSEPLNASSGHTVMIIKKEI